MIVYSILPSSKASLTPHNLPADDLANDLYTDRTTRRIHDPLLYPTPRALRKVNKLVLGLLCAGSWAVIAVIGMAINSVAK